MLSELIKTEENSFFLKPYKAKEKGIYVLYNDTNGFYLSYDPCSEHEYFVDNISKLLMWDWQYYEVALGWLKHPAVLKGNYKLKKLSPSEIKQLTIQP